MPKPKYPREAVLDHRERIAEEATRELARAVTERERKERERAAAEAEQRAALDRADAVRAAERAALEGGGLHAVDLARGAAWEVRAAEEARVEEARVNEARKREGDAAANEVGAREALANRKADADVLQKDKERYETAERKRIEAREEEAAQEVYRPIKA